MPNRIQGITVEIGGDTQGLSKALSGVNREIRTTQSQLKDVERLLKLDPGNTELLRQKYELLNDSIESTEEKLDSLREAEKQVQQQFERGEVSQDQYNGLQREIIATEQALGRLQNEARDTENRINGIDEKPIEQVEDAAEDAGDALRDAGDDASHFGDMLKAGAIVEGVSGLVDSMSQLADETREYQRIMGSLEVSSERAGYSAEETADTYRQLYGVLGDDQTAATTTANLQALGFAQEDLKDLTNAAIGAWATYGDSIPIDGLAESINETIQAGQVTGNFADVLNWAGTSEDDFNAKLENAADSTERVNIVMEELARQGVTPSLDYVLRDVEMRLGTALYLVRDGTAGQAMEAAAQEGIGRDGAPDNCVAGIKTGTAQTGAYQGERELMHHWYCGYVEGKTGPAYCVAVFREGVAEDGGVTAQVFQTLAQALGERLS